MQAVRDVVRRALMTVFLIPSSPESAVVEHRAIRAAIASGDPARARRRCSHHLVRVESGRREGSARMAELGYVGLGVMGSAISRRLLDAGTPCACGTARARRRSRCSRRARRWAESPREVAERSEVVFTMVTNTAAVRAVTDGAEGILAGLGPGKIYVDMSTASPANTRALGEEVAGAGAQMLDAPVSGTSITVEQGKASIMVGGDEDAFERVRAGARGDRPEGFPSFGPNGSAVTMKIAINLSLAVQMLAFSEGVLLAEKSRHPARARRRGDARIA